MPQFSRLVLVFTLLVFVAGCATRRHPPPPVAVLAPILLDSEAAPDPEPPEPAEPVRPEPLSRPLEMPLPVAAAPLPGPPPDAFPAVDPYEYLLLIQSEPAGATILINNVPVGRTPLEIPIQGTPQGFSRNYTSIKARFLATNPSEVSTTVELEITPLNRVPASIHFTPEGSQRQFR